MTTVDDILEHVGVKGMRWGVRKKRSQSHPWTEVSTGNLIKVKEKRGKVVVTGVTKKPASQDAQEVAILKAVKKKGGMQALSNKEIKTLNDRMKMEETLIKNLKARRGPVKKFISDLLNSTTSKVSNVATDFVAMQVGYGLGTKTRPAPKNPAPQGAKTAKKSPNAKIPTVTPNPNPEWVKEQMRKSSRGLGR